jgi:hypothetical protein
MMLDAPMSLRPTPMNQPSHLSDLYEVKLVDCPTLSADERAAAELRFRMALEFAVGGRHLVLPALQAFMLANELALGDDDGDDDEPDSDASVDDGPDAGQQVIALWQKAESDALRAALKPLGKSLDNARFEIIPR